MKIKNFLVINIVIIMVINSCTTDPSSSKNTKPTADFTFDPDSGNTATLFVFNANSSSDEEDNIGDLQVRWDWENDGIWDTDYSTIKNTTHQFTIEGTYVTALEVMDTEELTNAITKSISVSKENTPPTASFSVTPNSGSVNDVFNFDASSSFDEEDETADLQVRWDWENDGNWDSDYSTTKTATHQFTTIGTYVTKLEVKDSQGWTNSVTEEISVQRQSVIVNIADDNFEALIRLKLGKNNEDITDIDLESITSLNGDGWNISDISGIEYCLFIQKLDLRNNNIININPLNSLVTLTNLTLSNNQLSDIGPLSGLINLEVLGLSDNVIDNIEPLSNLSNLRLLFLGNNQFTNIESVVNLVNIKEIGFANNQIVDISALIQNSGIDTGDIITLTDNPLSNTSINTYIPQLEARGVTVNYE